MITISMTNNNNIITLNSPGKNPIKSSEGLYFHSPMELLCSAIGACVGKHIVRFANEFKLDLSKFEYFGVGMDDYKIIIVIKHPTTLEQSILDELRKRLYACEVANLIKEDTIEIRFENNTVSDEELTKINSERKPCCGGNIF